MSRIKQIGGKTIVLTTLLWFGLCGASAIASEPETTAHGADTESHQASVEHGDTHETSHAQPDDKHMEADTHGGGHGAEHKDSLSPEKLKDLMWRVMNFAVLLFILIKFGAKPISAALSGRKAEIKEEIEDLENKRAEAERSYKDFETKLAGMEDEIGTVVEKAIAQAEIEKEKIIESAKQAADDIKLQAEMAIQNEIVTVRRNLKNDMADQATVMAEEIIVKNLKPEDQNKIIEDYLNKVGALQ